MIEDDFTRPRTHDLEQQLDDDDDEGEEDHFQGFSGDEEREFVRRWSGYDLFFWWPDFAGTRRKSTRATSRHSTRYTRPTQENVKRLQILFLQSSRAALVRLLSYAARIDVRLFSLIPAYVLRLCGISTSPAQFFSPRPVGLAGGRSSPARGQSYKARVVAPFHFALIVCLCIAHLPPQSQVRMKLPTPPKASIPKWSRSTQSAYPFAFRQKMTSSRTTFSPRVPESASSYVAIVPARFPSHSKLSPHCPHGHASSRSLRPSSGRRRPRTPQLEYSYRI